MSPSVDHAQGLGTLAAADQQQDQVGERGREATELHQYADTSGQELNRLGTRSTQSSNSRGPLKTFWRHHVVAAVPHEKCRDHFALERTYLGYFRTALALAFLGVFIAQLFRLQHSQNPDPVFGFFVLGIPLSCTCTVAAIVVNLLGTYRFWRQQNAMLRGKILGGGWELHATFAVVLLTVFVIFVLVLAVDIYKD